MQILSAHGVPLKIIARTMHVTERALRRACREQLVNGAEYVKAAVGAAVVRSALAGNFGAQRFWLERWGGPEWKATAAPDLASVAPVGGGLTVIVRNALPDVVYDDAPEIEGGIEEAEPGAATELLIGSNGKGNGRGY